MSHLLSLLETLRNPGVASLCSVHPACSDFSLVAFPLDAKASHRLSPVYVFAQVLQPALLVRDCRLGK